jgi:hypothetical protein
MTTSQPRPVRAVFTGLIGLGAAALITASAESASATTLPARSATAPTVRAASTSLHVTPSRAIRIGVTARHVHRADHLAVQQYYHRAWRSITVYRVHRSSAMTRHTFDLGRAPAGRYLVRVALIRHTHRIAKTRAITITCRGTRPPSPPRPPRPPSS